MLKSKRKLNEAEVVATKRKQDEQDLSKTNDNEIKSGQLLISGLVSFCDTDSKVAVSEKNMLTEFHRFTDTKYRFIASSKYTSHSILIDSNGRAYSLGRNKKWESGQKDTSAIYESPTLIPKMKGINIVQAACGRYHSLFLSNDGQVYACGDNSKGQCGIGKARNDAHSPTLIKYDGPKIVKIDCGADFSVILDVNGHLYAFGSPEFGQLGNNTNGQYFITTTKLSFHFEYEPLLINWFMHEERRGEPMTQMEDVCIKDFACGKFHTIAVDTMGQVFTWGFGGNGQLGHNGNKDEMRPRLLKYLLATRNMAAKIFCGGKYSVVLTIDRAFFLCGEFGGKNFMYPQQNPYLQGYTYNTVGCSDGSILATTNNQMLVVWGKAPSYGELGIGNNPRSSSVPMENANLKDMKIIQIAAGNMYSMLLIDTECHQTKKKYLEFAEYNP